MAAADSAQLTIADAQETDIPALAQEYFAEPLLRDYLRSARDSLLRCLVLRRGQKIIGAALLVYRRPEFWPNTADLHRLPEVVGLTIAASQRSVGYGSAFMRAIETEAAHAGHRHLYLVVDPINNPRAYAFYRRLNYQPLQSEPYQMVWQFMDSQQNLYRGGPWLIDMVKSL